MSNGQKVTSNLLWRFLERTGAQGVTFIVSIVLARILGPDPYGAVSMILVFITILQVFVDSGLGTALVQKKDADDLDFSTVFWFNISSCSFLYILLFAFSGIIADFYNMPELKDSLRVLGVIIIISGIKNIQQSYVSRNMMFKKFFFSTLAGTIGAAFIGIILAYTGFGIWAIIAQYLFNALIDTIVLWVTVRWRPHFIFSFSRLKSLFSYGWKLLVSSLIDTVYREIRSLIIGKIYSTSDLAYYNQGNKFPKTIVENINISIDSVLLPAMSSVQDSRESVKSMTRRAIKVSTYCMMPMMVGLAVCATPIVKVLLTDKWLPCVFFLRVFCFTYAFYPIHTANLNAIKAMGRSDLYLKLEIIKKSIGLIALVSTMFISVKAMALSMLVTSIVSQIVNSWPNKKLLEYSYFEQIRDIIPQIVISIIMGFIVFAISLTSLSPIICLCIQIPLGAALYIILSKVFKLDSYMYIKHIIRGMISKR